MSRVKLTAGRKSSGPVVLHLDRGAAHDLLLALTQALEPHPKSIADMNSKFKKPRGQQFEREELEEIRMIG